MKRFVNKPAKAQRKFNRQAYKVHSMNLRSTPMRGGIRL